MTIWNTNPAPGNDNASPPLSSAGEARRNALFLELNSTLRRRRVTRKVVRATSLAAAIALASFAGLTVIRSNSPQPTAPSQGTEIATNTTPLPTPIPPPLTAPAPTSTTPTPPTAPSTHRLATITDLSTPSSIHIETVETQSNSLARYTIAATTSRAELIDDTQLLSDLREAGRPDGLIRVGKKVTIVSDNPPSTDLKPSSQTENSPSPVPS